MKNGLPAWAVLGIIAVVAGLLLGVTNEFTQGVIAEQNAALAAQAMREVLSEAEEFEPVELQGAAAVDNCYKGLRNGEVVGYTAQVTVNGYGGEIEVIVGMDLNKAITGISVGGPNFNETTGLGAKTKEPDFTNQFRGVPYPVVLGEDVDAVTSATISSTAVVSGVNTAAEYMSTLIGQ